MRPLALALLLCAACGSGTGAALDGAPFGQKDLEGTWRFAVISHGPTVVEGATPGWVRGTLEADPTGALAISGDDSAGHVVGGTGSLRVDAEGFLTSPDFPTLAGRVNKGRDFAVATGTENGTPSIRFTLKSVPGTTWSLADLASSRFAYHVLGTGTAPSWEHGVAVIDGSGAMTLTQRTANAGPEADLAAGTLSVSASGIAALSTDTTWKGYLSADKTVMVATQTREATAHRYALIVLTRLGQSFAPSDLAGNYGFYRLVASSAGGGWACGRMAIDAAGAATMTSLLTNMGPQALPGPQVVTLQADGVIRNPASPTFHSVMGFNKDLSVRTETTGPQGAPYSMLSVSVK
jgi:hypothetical protein